MAEDKKFKSPSELGSAVGQKIDEIFGESVSEESVIMSTRRPAPEQKSVSEVADRAGSSDAVLRDVAGPRAPSPPPKAPTPVPRCPQPPAASAERPSSPDRLIDQTEALVLELEWETSQKAMQALSLKLKELEDTLPQKGPARVAVQMSLRILEALRRGASPHPRVAQLLQGSISVARQTLESGGRRSVDPALLNSLNEQYKQIMASSMTREATDTGAAPAASEIPLEQLVGNVGGAVSALDEVSQRLAKIVGVLRKGGDMSRDEVTRRLSTVETLLVQRVGQLSAAHRRLAEMGTETGAGSVAARLPDKDRYGPDGLLLISWSGLPMAVPSSFVSALYPLPKPQAAQLSGKQSIMLGNREIPRLPLKHPRVSQLKDAPPPSWLIHLAMGGREFYLLAERALGYRRLPKGVDVQRQGTMRIGSISYTILNQATIS
ncbi:MAG: hypothetical protein AB1473_19855 [Thermodesulfobacteriota bacterium]